MKQLRIVRICISLAVFAAITAAIALGYSVWLSRMQIIPALMSCSLVWLAVWVVVTALFGRVYCSSACPMGTLQDIFIFISRRRRRGFFYSLPRPALRSCIAVAALTAMAVGISLVTGLLDPYSAYSRVVVYLGSPLIRPVAFSLLGGAVAFVTLAVVAVAALLRGRLLCNTLCPVGTLLGTLSRYSLYHVDIDTDKCIGCDRCVSRCKAECISPADHTVDLSRCVVCFDCLTDCPASAITYRRGRHQLRMPMLQSIETAKPSAMSRPESAASDSLRTMDRRRFLGALLGAATALPAAASLKGALKPLNWPAPPGAPSRADYFARCTSCSACAAACPTGAIKPSAGELGLGRSMVPLLDFNAGPCRYDCQACTRVCPSGALQPLTPGQKHRYVIGKARLDPDLCLLYEHDEGCGLCARRCPVQAIKIVAVDGRRMPRVDFDRCIGCGECQWVCPARPRAFVIEGE